MAWRVAESLLKFQEQLNEAAPNRSTVSDGFIGDADHANRTSDHNPWCGPGVVTAGDFTHDPEKGANMHKWAEALRESRDPRIKYVIWDGRMFSSYATSTSPAFTWRDYDGVNLHTAHMHVSVNCDASKDSTRAWATPQERDWFDMATKAELREIVQDEIKKSEARLREAIQHNRKLLAVGKEQKGYNSDHINLKAVEERLKS